MRTRATLLFLSLLATCAAVAADNIGLSRLAVSGEEARLLAEAGREKAGRLVRNETGAISYIWVDKITYSPGEQIKLMWTVAPNFDLFPYTFFCYRQNLQTGEKRYLPGLTEEATDIEGRSMLEGFTIARAPERAKAVLLGSGGQFPAASATAPAELGMHQFVLEIRDYTGTRVVKASYVKFGVVSGTEELRGDITSDRTLTNDKKWLLKGGVFVMPGVTLTIQPGTFIAGDQGALSLLAVTQGAKLMAEGTRARPIIFTSNRAVGERDRNDWGGLIINGKAPINVPGGVAQAEGIDDPVKGSYGGQDPNDNSGVIRYVRVEFGGFPITTTNELNCIAFNGVGRGTRVDHVQAHFGGDDAFEWFGGTVDAKHLVATYYDDDGFDWVEGWQGRLQYGVAHQRGDRVDNGIEADNNNRAGRDVTPRSSPAIYNLTLVGDPGETSRSGEGIQLREGTAGNLNNVVVLGFGAEGLRVDHAETSAQAAAGNLKASSIILWQNRKGKTSYSDQFNADGLNFAATQKNVLVMDPRLLRPFTLGDPDFRPAEGSPVGNPGLAVPPPDDGFFDTSANFVGAFGFGRDNWLEEWSNLLNEADLLPAGR